MKYLFKAKGQSYGFLDEKKQPLTGVTMLIQIIYIVGKSQFFFLSN